MLKFDCLEEEWRKKNSIKTANVTYKLDEYFCLLDVMTSVSDKVISNELLCKVL